MFSQATVILFTEGRGGTCVAGGMHGRGCVAGETATAADGMHPIGSAFLFCFVFFDFYFYHPQQWLREGNVFTGKGLFKHVPRFICFQRVDIPGIGIWEVGIWG